MPHERRCHRIEPVEVLIEVSSAQSGDRTRLPSNLVLSLDARAIGRPHDGAGEQKQKGAGGDDVSGAEEAAR